MKLTILLPLAVLCVEIPTAQNIHIAVSQHPQYLLGEDLSDMTNSPFRISKERSNFISRARINQDGDMYRIRINGKYICRRGEAATACPRGDLFSVREFRFGYRIIQGTKCLRAGDEYSLAIFSKCKGDDREQFIFSDETLRYCIEDYDDEGPRNAAEQQQYEQAKKQAKAKGIKLSRQKTAQDEIAALKPSKKMAALLNKLDKRGWKMWKLRLRFC